MKLANTDAPTTVRIPHTTIDRLLMAPSTGPISMALAVPTACELAPMAMPLAIGSSTLKILSTKSAGHCPILRL